MRPSGMRFRVAVLLLLLAACGKESLPKLPVSATGGNERSSAMAADATSMWAPYPSSYRVEGDLPDLPDEAPAYDLVAEAGDAARVAEALGHAAADITVSDQPGRPWQLNGARDLPVSSDVACPECAPLPRAPGLLSDEAAEQKAREVLARMGVSGGEAEIRETPVSVEVTIRPTVGGLPTVGWEHHLSLGIDGIPIGGFGWLGRPQKLGDYPLVSAEEAIERLKEAPVEDAPVTLVAPVEQVEPVEPEPQEIVLHDVDLVLQQVEGHLVPAFRFERGPIVPAVVDRLLADVAPPPRTEPAPEPTDGGQACSGAAAGAPAGTDNQPLTVQVCGPSTAEVGEEVVFDVTAADPDAPIYEGQCDGTIAGFGEEPVATIGCAPGCTEPSPKEPGKLARQYRHTYEKPGTYTAQFSFHSGPCGPYESRGEGTHTVVVH